MNDLNGCNVLSRERYCMWQVIKFVCYENLIRSDPDHVN